MCKVRNCTNQEMVCNVVGAERHHTSFKWSQWNVRVFAAARRRHFMRSSPNLSHSFWTSCVGKHFSAGLRNCVQWPKFECGSGPCEAKKNLLKRRGFPEHCRNNPEGAKLIRAAVAFKDFDEFTSEVSRTFWNSEVVSRPTSQRSLAQNCANLPVIPKCKSSPSRSQYVLEPRQWAHLPLQNKRDFAG